MIGASRGPRCKLVVRVSNLTLYTPNSRGGGKPHLFNYNKYKNTGIPYLNNTNTSESLLM